jgi:hypothetical protein
MEHASQAVQEPEFYDTSSLELLQQYQEDGLGHREIRSHRRKVKITVAQLATVLLLSGTAVLGSATLIGSTARFAAHVAESRPVHWVNAKSGALSEMLMGMEDLTAPAIIDLPVMPSPRPTPVAQPRKRQIVSQVIKKSPIKIKKQATVTNTVKPATKPVPVTANLPETPKPLPCVDNQASDQREPRGGTQGRWRGAWLEKVQEKWSRGHTRLDALHKLQDAGKRRSDTSHEDVS